MATKNRTRSTRRGFRPPSLKTLSLILIACALILALPASADTVTVRVCSEGCDYSTVQEAVGIDVQPEDEVKIVIEPGTYFENVIISRSLILMGNGWHPSETVIDGSASGSVFEVQAGAIVEFNNLTITNGAANDGGGIDNRLGQVKVRKCVVLDNRAENEGGGIFSEDGVLNVSETTILGNTADRENTASAGGGIFVRNGTAEIGASLLRGNAAANGGGLANRGSQVTLDNTTVYGNLADLGGGLDNREGGELRISYSTIVFNTSSNGHGGLCSDSPTEIASSIMAYNYLLGPGMPPQCSGVLNSGTYNLVHAYSNWLNFASDPSDLMNVIPVKLEWNPADNSGPTKTLALLPDSPAVDAIPEELCQPLDQRLTVRSQDGDGDGIAACDIGAYELSHWDRQGDEAPTITPGTPLRYPGVWQRERETLGYNPRFVPNTVTFNQANLPVIRAGVHGEIGRHATVYPSSNKVDDSYIQMLSPTGEWIGISLSRVLRQTVDGWDGKIHSGTFQSEERVVFAAETDAYTVVTTSDGNFLLYSDNNMQSWTAYELERDGRFLVEPGSSDGEPVVLGVTDKKLWAMFPVKDQPSGLKPFTFVELAPDMDIFLGPYHSGVGRKTATVGEKTHIVFGSLEEADGRTEQYVVTYDHGSQSATTPVLLGTNPCSNLAKCPDVHDGPAIAADDTGGLHAVLGAHYKRFKYTTLAADADDSSGWSDADEFAKGTYVSLVIDQSNVLHQVSRRTDGDGRSLRYMRKKPGAQWEIMGKLVTAAPYDDATIIDNRYGVWYHKLTVDRDGRLYLAYFYYSHELSSTERAAYLTKWPDEDLNGDGYIENSEIRAHDPVILMSDDGGDSWRLATTEDFTNGM